MSAVSLILAVCHLLEQLRAQSGEVCRHLVVLFVLESDPETSKIP